MQTAHLIAVEEFCSHHQVETAFIFLLSQHGLIEVITRNKKHFIDPEELEPVEKMVRLYTDLQINLEGIEAITYLLKRFQDLQQQVNHLQNKVRFYEQVVGVAEV